MNRNLIILILIITAITAVSLGLANFYFNKPGNPIPGAEEQKPLTQNITEIPPDQAPKPPSLQEDQEAINRRFPDIIKGIIKFFDKDSVFKTTLTTSDGKSYTLYPNQPKNIYQEIYGAKNGGMVEIKGKIEGNLIKWTTMKPI